MKRILPICLFFFVSHFVKAQDSTQVINQEIGFNTVSLIKQVISNNPTSTLPQLPYDVFYNLYVRNTVGLRLGIGISNSHTKTDVLGLPAPRTTDQTALNARAGLSYNFVRSQKVTLNVFGDFLYEKVSLETSSTSTSQPFPNPVQTTTVKTSDIIKGIGGDFGVGVKYNFYKHLSIYAEVPLVFMTEKNTDEVILTSPTSISVTSNSSKNSLTRIIIPTTIYLVLRF